MAYDGLDRLRSVTAPGFGNALYEYDALDNLRRAKVGSRDRTHYFDPTNRLVNVVDTGSSATVVGLGYDVQGNLSIRNGGRLVSTTATACVRWERRKPICTTRMDAG